MHHCSGNLLSGKLLPPLFTPPPALQFLCLECSSHAVEKKPLFSNYLFFFHPSLSIYRCPSDFVGNRCQYPSPCSPSPCRNGGECRAVSHGNTFDFRCVCRLGFTDRLCLTPTNHACMSSPCRNGGTCDLITLSAYRCRCPPGWSGMRLAFFFIVTMYTLQFPFWCQT